MTQIFPRSLPFVFVTGGCRSGKSAYAQREAEKCGPERLYVATCEVRDEETAERVRLHAEARGPGWRVHEAGADPEGTLCRALPALIRPGEVLLFDCLTLWSAGRMRGDEAPPDFAAACDALLEALWRLPCPVFLVGGEVGMGVVPSSKAGRVFRDMAGLAGQKAAALAPEVIFMVSGIPLPVKSPPCDKPPPFAARTI